MNLTEMNGTFFLYAMIALVLCGNLAHGCTFNCDANVQGPQLPDTGRHLCNQASVVIDKLKCGVTPRPDHLFSGFVVRQISEIFNLVLCESCQPSEPPFPIANPTDGICRLIARNTCFVYQHQPSAARFKRCTGVLKETLSLWGQCRNIIVTTRRGPGDITPFLCQWCCQSQSQCSSDVIATCGCDGRPARPLEPSLVQCDNIMWNAILDCFCATGQLPL